MSTNKLVEALRKIERWFGEFPPSGKTWPDGQPVSYGVAFGSNGQRDYMRGVARSALAAFKAGQEVGEAEDVFKFLLGEGPLAGIWFGEEYPPHKGQFWWREHLRASLATQPLQEQEDDYAPGYSIEEAIKVAKLWRCGKLVGGDAHSVSTTLLNEIERLQAKYGPHTT